MYSFSLFLLGIIQISNGFTALYASHNPHIMGPYMLPLKYGLYRNMLTALWISVGIVYLIGAFNALITPGATLLAMINVFLEIIGYWNSGLPKWYVWIGTIVMGLLGIWCGFTLRS